VSHQPDRDNTSKTIRFAATVLRVEPSTLSEEWGKLRQNRQALLRASTWHDIVTNLPKRTFASLVLIGLLLIAVFIANATFVTSSGETIVQVKLPQRLKVSKPTGTSRPTATGTPASLISASAVADEMPKGTPTSTPVPSVTPVFLFHTVQADETFVSIAAQYNIAAEDLLVANNIRDPNKISTGQYLLIPASDEFTKQKVFIHEVRDGDTPLSIAIKYGSSVKDIQHANPELNGDQALTEGQTVAVPIVFVKANPVIAPNISEDTIYHTVKGGEIPLLIAAQYDIPVEILLSVNEIVDPRGLQVGQELVIPPHDGISLGFPVILYELLPTDTLVGVASKFSSSVKDILAINPDLDPANLANGQLVAVPIIFRPPKPTPDPAAPRPTPGPPPPGNLDLEEQVVQAINARRVENGLPPHTFDGQISEVALKHAQDMYVRDFFAHVNPDGVTLRNRLADGGVSFFRAGENIQRNTQPRDSTVQAAVEWFMNSPPHRANILHPTHNRVGVAVVEGPPGWYTFVINFAER
jgi:uncharacterized protein YkwD